MKGRISQHADATSQGRSRVQRDLANACRFEALESRTLMSASILAAPSALTATAAAPIDVQLHWKDNASTATGYNVLRSTDGVHYTELTQIKSASASSFTDATAVSGHVYDYEIQAYNGSVTSAASNVAKATTPLVTPTGFTASLSGSSVKLAWTDSDSSATGYYIARSTDDVHFYLIATINGASTKSYTDSATATGTKYYYIMESFNAVTTSALSTTASVTTPLVTPTSLTANVSGFTIKLAWTDNDSSATGYYVLRSTDGVHFSQIATISSGSTRSYTDSATASGTKYYYQVEAFNAVTTSAASAAASATMPSLGVTITTRYGDELVVTAAGADDSVSILESGSTFTIDADGKTYTDAALAGGLFVYTRGGTDAINVDKSVKSQTTLETIDGALTTITSAGTDVIAWIDSTDKYSGTGTVHDVASFAGGVSKAVGAALANPTDAGKTVTVNASLFGTGPVAGDVNQGEVGDCYFLSSLAAFAGQNPNVLVQSAVDMGDGTYTVQFISNGKPTFVRVSNQFSAGPFEGLLYAHPGTDGSIWAMVIEKAFAYFRTGANTYASTNSGWMGEAYSDFGVNSTAFNPSSYTATTLYNLLSADLSAGKEVTLGTSNSAPDLVSDHAYTLVSAYKDSKGVTYYVVRNPWGDSGDSLENSQGYATLTFAQLVANYADGCASV
ncbi:MAG: C2 family cysteine protease [Tepidisphaeraceae bacterium]|jgi:fibronectin type 3 domain-containing protein